MNLTRFMLFRQSWWASVSNPWWMSWWWRSLGEALRKWVSLFVVMFFCNRSSVCQSRSWHPSVLSLVHVVFVCKSVLSKTLLFGLKSFVNLTCIIHCYLFIYFFPPHTHSSAVGSCQVTEIPGLLGTTLFSTAGISHTLFWPQKILIVY